MNLKKLILKKSGGYTGVYMGLQVLKDEVSPEDFALFLEKSLNGQALWEDFMAHYEQAGIPGKGYNFISYAKEKIVELRK